jgi:hypothetical protein
MLSHRNFKVEILRDELITDQQYSLWQKRLVPEQCNTNDREHGDRYLAVAYLVCIHGHLLGIKNQRASNNLRHKLA